MFLQYDKIVNCLIQKAASTTWFAEFWQLESNTTLPNGERPKIEKKRLRMKKEIFESMSSDPKFPLLLFSTVRHPLDRIVSCYRNKFEANGLWVPKYGDLSFKQFVQMVITESKHYGKMDINEVNVHWRPFYLSPCGFCELPFTVIAKTENLKNDMKFIGQVANLNFTTSIVKNQHKREKSTRDYLSLLDNKTLSQLIKVYQPDFEMFQYSPEVI